MESPHWWYPETSTVPKSNMRLFLAAQQSFWCVFFFFRLCSFGAQSCGFCWHPTTVAAPQTKRWRRDASRDIGWATAKPPEMRRARTWQGPKNETTIRLARLMVKLVIVIPFWWCNCMSYIKSMYVNVRMHLFKWEKLGSVKMFKKNDEKRTMIFPQRKHAHFKRCPSWGCEFVHHFTVPSVDQWMTSSLGTLSPRSQTCRDCRSISSPAKRPVFSTPGILFLTQRFAQHPRSGPFWAADEPVEWSPKVESLCQTWHLDVD